MDTAGNSKKKSGDERKAASVAEIREAFQTIKAISDLLRTGLDAEMLASCIRLIEEGVNPDALARVVTEMSREADRLDNAQQKS